MGVPILMDGRAPLVLLLSRFHIVPYAFYYLSPFVCDLRRDLFLCLIAEVSDCEVENGGSICKLFIATRTFVAGTVVLSCWCGYSESGGGVRNVRVVRQG